jgi:hypothetical protein
MRSANRNYDVVSCPRRQRNPTAKTRVGSAVVIASARHDGSGVCRRLPGRRDEQQHLRMELSTTCRMLPCSTRKRRCSLIVRCGESQPAIVDSSADESGPSLRGRMAFSEKPEVLIRVANLKVMRRRSCFLLSGRSVPRRLG